MPFRALYAIVLLWVSTVSAQPTAEISRTGLVRDSARIAYAETRSSETARKAEPTFPEKRMYREISPGPESCTGVVICSQAAVVGSPAHLPAGTAAETQVLKNLGLAKNTPTWRPSPADMDSAAFKVIVGDAKFTRGGLPKGTIFDSVGAGNVEIKSGTTMLESSYQLRLQVYKSLKEGGPMTLRTNRPVNPTFSDWLQRWGVVVKPLE